MVLNKGSLKREQGVGGGETETVEVSKKMGKTGGEGNTGGFPDGGGLPWKEEENKNKVRSGPRKL